jgi:hypothetical protein
MSPSSAMDERCAMDSATGSLRSRAETVRLNFDWLVDAGFHFDDPNGEMVMDPDREGGFGVELLGEEGLTPATR